MNLLDFAIQTTNQYIDQIPKSQRKKYGQFFTSKETAIFMADLFDVPAGKQHCIFLIPERVLEYYQLLCLKDCKGYLNLNLSIWFVMKTIQKLSSY